MKRIKFPQRLLKLADLLEADAKDRNGIKFDYRNWGTTDGLERKVKHAPVSCHTSACAMGLAALSGKFKRFGLDHQVETEQEYDGTFWGDIQFLWKGRRIDGVTAARRLFGISFSDAHYLFVGGLGNVESRGAKAERAVAKIIRSFVKDA